MQARYGATSVRRASSFSAALGVREGGGDETLRVAMQVREINEEVTLES